MKKKSAHTTKDFTTLADVLDSSWASTITSANASNLSIFIFIVHGLAESLSTFPRNSFFNHVRTSNFHMVLVANLLILQLRGYEDISSDDLYDSMSKMFKVSHSNFRRILDQAVKDSVFEKTFSSFDKRVKQYRISDYGLENLAHLVEATLVNLQGEFEKTLLNHENHELYEPSMRILSLAQDFSTALHSKDQELS